MPFAALSLGASPGELGLVLAAQHVPFALLALVGGAWADRLERRTVMVASDLIRAALRSEEHTSELQSRQYIVCRLLLEKKNQHSHTRIPLFHNAHPLRPPAYATATIGPDAAQRTPSHFSLPSNHSPVLCCVRSMHL